MNNEIICLITAVTLISVLTLYHFLRNYNHYSSSNRINLPLCYVASIIFLFVGYQSMWFIIPFGMITSIKCIIYKYHVKQMVWDFSKPEFRKKPCVYIVFNDAMALICIFSIKTFFWVQIWVKKL